MMELRKLVDEGEIREEEVPETKTIEGWITRYSASLRKESAEKRVAESNESRELEERVAADEGGFERDGANNQEQKKQKMW